MPCAWPCAAKLGCKVFSEIKTIHIPINMVKEHWYLACVDLTNHTIVFKDSMWNFYSKQFGETTYEKAFKACTCCSSCTFANKCSAHRKVLATSS